MQSCVEKFLQIFNSGKYLEMLELSDANLQTDDGCNFKVHRFALANSSDYFRRMFLGTDKNRRIFHIPGISGECLCDILCYLYTGDIRVTERNVADLMIGAEYLLLEDLQMKIKGNIEDNLTEVNCLSVLRATHRIGDEDKLQECFKYIQMIFKTLMRCEKDGLTDLPLDILRRILSNRNLFVSDETVVWQAIVAWTQKDTPLRMSCVPQLLLTLAVEDVGEELATEILKHEIVSENSFMKDLLETTPSNELPTNLDVLSKFFQSYSLRFTEPILRHRIPFQIFVAWSDDRGKMNLYVTYDENTDLWRKITKLILWPDVLIVIGHNVYIFNMEGKQCIKFDLNAMDWVSMGGFRDTISMNFCIVATDAYIYVLGNLGIGYSVEVYDTANDRWEMRAPLRNISRVAAVVIENNIYVVGNYENHAMFDEIYENPAMFDEIEEIDENDDEIDENNDEIDENDDEIDENDVEMIMAQMCMMTQMFDPDTKKWSILSPPTVYHREFSVVAYHGKIYLIGDSDAEVFSPTINMWEKLPGNSYKRSSPKAKVINDQIIVTDDNGYYEYWNNAKACFEPFIKNDIFDGLPLQFSRFCTVDDAETIKVITKRNRAPEKHRMKKKFW